MERTQPLLRSAAEICSSKVTVTLDDVTVTAADELRDLQGVMEHLKMYSSLSVGAAPQALGWAHEAVCEIGLYLVEVLVRLPLYPPEVFQILFQKHQAVVAAYNAASVGLRRLISISASPLK